MTKRQKLAKKNKKRWERKLLLLAKRYSSKPKQVTPTIKLLLEALNATSS